MHLVLIIILIGVVALLSASLAVLAIQSRHRAIDHKKEIEDRTVELERQVEKAKAAADAKSAFLSQMSHEIRTPLNAIIGMIQIVRGTLEPTLIHGYSEKMEDNAKHLLGILNDILDFSKMESDGLILEEECFSLHRNIDFVASMFKDRARQKSLIFRTEFDGIIHDGIVADRLRFNQVLINLLSNAVKFTDEGGKIVLIAEELAHLDGESVYRFSVEDNGIGIDPEQAKKLFTPFTQANAGVSRLYGGTGLGLSIAQNIVQMMGGEIELETQLGQGAVFRFTIRVKAMKEAEEETSAIRTISDKCRGKRILIVDDIEINREIIVALLEGSGVVIEMASNGKEALDIYNGSDPYWFDMILMDIQMPVMGGCEATEAIRVSGKACAQDVKIIAMTANVLPEDVERAYLSGVNGYLAKPVEVELLYKIMEMWL